MPTQKAIQYSMKVKFGFKLFSTTPNNMPKGVQIDATYNIQQCWELLQHRTGTSCSHIEHQARMVDQESLVN